MRGSSTTDVSLVTAARGGDGAAYAELFERYHARIYNYAYGIVGNREDAGDIAQEAFVRVFEALPRLTGDLNFSAYLYRTAHNVGIDAVKHRGRFVSPDALEVQHEPSLRADPERVSLVQEQQGQTWEAAFTLSDKHREILTLRELHDMSYQDIADVLGMPRTTVGVLLSRARLKFKEAFRMSSVDIDKLAEECRELLPLLSTYIDDELDSAKRAQVEAHLEDCAFCRLALEEMTEASRSYRALLPLLPPAALGDGVWTRLGDLLPAEEGGATPSDGPRSQGESPAGERPEQWGTDAAESAARPGEKSAALLGEESAARPAEESAGGTATKAVRKRLPIAKMIAAGTAGALVVLLSVWVAAGLPGLEGSGRATEPTVASADDGSATTAAISATPTGDTLRAPETTPAPSYPQTDTTSAPQTTASETTTPSESQASSDTSPTPAPSSATPPADPGQLTTTSGQAPGGRSPSPSAQDPAGAVTPGPSEPEAGATPSPDPDRAAPPAPQLVAPANGSVVEGGKVTLQWRPVKDPSGVTYRVEIQSYDDKAGSYVTTRVVEGVAATKLSHSMKSLRERWRVAAVDGAGNKGPASEWWKMGQAITLVVPLKPVETTTLY